MKEMFRDVPQQVMEGELDETLGVTGKAIDSQMMSKPPCRKTTEMGIQKRW